MSDLVHDLRKGRGLTEGKMRDAWLHETMQKAADEIESLRARLAEAERLLREIYSYAEDQGMETLMDMIDAADSATGVEP